MVVELADRRTRSSHVSCHTALPLALARPALRGALHGRAVERRAENADDVIKRVTLREVEPFYLDQTRGLPKTANRAEPNRS
jgi:hypothetical protein